MQKCLIVAVGQNHEIGVKGALPWHISADLQYFKRTTKGFPVIMGRTTYFSLPVRPLPGRRNIVLNLGGFSLPVRPLPGRRNIVLNLGGDPIPEVACVYSFPEAYAAAEATGAEKCFVIGGASVYKAALPEMDLLYITHVHASVPEADVFFPAIDPQIWERESTSETFTDPETGYEFEFVIYRKRI